MIMGPAVRASKIKNQQLRMGALLCALNATLTAADVDFYKATDLALQLAADAGVWDRTAGLQGVWGPMIEGWLDELLPPDVFALF